MNIIEEEFDNWSGHSPEIYFVVIYFLYGINAIADPTLYTKEWGIWIVYKRLVSNKKPVKHTAWKVPNFKNQISEKHVTEINISTMICENYKKCKLKCRYIFIQKTEVV